MGVDSQVINKTTCDSTVSFFPRLRMSYLPDLREQRHSLKLGVCVDRLYITAAVLLFRAINSGHGFRAFEVLINQT
jgi:hypothetical protein